MITLDGRGSLTSQLARSIRRAVRTRTFVAGDRLPSSRHLSADLGVSRNVVISAYDQLIAEGYLVTRPKAGTFVSPQVPEPVPTTRIRDKPRPAHPAGPALNATANRIVAAGRKARRLAVRAGPATVNFEYGSASGDEQTALEWHRTYRQLMRSHDGGYGDPVGEPGLREEISRHLARHRGLNVTPEQIVVTSGSQQALDLIARLWIEPGDSVVVEEPTYQGATQVFFAAGAKVRPVDVDGQGMVVDRLYQRGTAAKLVYVTPSHQFPTGVVMPVSRRLDLLEWARQTDCYLIEDDYDSEFRYDCRPIESIAAIAGLDRVIYLGTFAKSLNPALRIGYLVLPVTVVEAFSAAKWLTDRGNPSLPQCVLAEFMRNGSYQRHLRRCNRRYAGRRACLVAALEAQLGGDIRVAGADAGTHLVCWFRRLSPSRLSQLMDACAARSVAVYPITPYYLRRPPKHAGLLLGFSGVSKEQIRRGAREIGRAYRNLLELETS